MNKPLVTASVLAAVAIAPWAVDGDLACSAGKGKLAGGPMVVCREDQSNLKHLLGE